MNVRIATALALVAGCGGPSFAVPLDAAPVIAQCSRMSMLADDFAAAQLSTWWHFETSSDAITETTGDGLSLAAGDIGDASVTATRFLDLRGDRFSAAVSADTTAGAVDLRLVAAGDPFDALSIARDHGMLRFAYDIDGGRTELAAIPYDATTQRYWRIETTADTVLWSTSPDGAAYALQATAPRFAWVTYMQPVLAVHRAANDAPVAATFRDVDGSTPTGSACAAATLTDDFSSATIADHWRWSAVRGSLSPQDGRLELYYPPAAQVELNLGSSTIYDVRDGVFAFEVPVAVPQTAGFYVTITTIDGPTTELDENGGDLLVPLPGGQRSAILFETAYDPVADRWIRFHEANGKLHWEASADGQTYQDVWTQPTIRGLDRASISILFNGGSDSISAPVMLALDNFNIPPP